MFALGTSFLFALLLTSWLASRRPPVRVLDEPNERSLHVRPVPRTGGLAVIGGIAGGWATIWFGLGWNPALSVVALTAAIVAIVSFLDDLFGLSPVVRLIVQTAAASGLAFGLLIGAHPLIMLGVVLASVWMANLYNFMDGMDGFASGMAGIGFMFLGLAGWFSEHMMFTYVNWVISVAALGFLSFNVPPAQIFLGDVGSVTLGFLAAAMAILGVQWDVFPLWFPILVFLPFIADATVTLIKRIVKRERIWQAHREHYYQRLVRMGWGHGRTVSAEYLFMSMTGGSAIILLDHPDWVPGALMAWGVALALLSAWVDWRWRRFSSAE